MAQSSCVVSLPQMIDLALNSPEIGVVNFNILHSLLHVIVQQLELSDCNVEFRGPNSDKMQNVIATSKPGPSINLTEYVVTPGKDAGKVVSKRRKIKKAKRLSTDSGKKGSKEVLTKEEEIRLIEQRKNSKDEPAENPEPMAAPKELGAKTSSSSSFQTVVVIEPTQEGITTPQVSVAVPRSLIDTFQEELQNIKEQVQELVELPANSGLIEAVRATGEDKSSPVLDMFQILNLTKRLDAAETGINKLASMIEDLARERPSESSQHVLDRAEEIRSSIARNSYAGSKTLVSADRIQSIEDRISALETATTGKRGSLLSARRGSTQSAKKSSLQEEENAPNAEEGKRASKSAKRQSHHGEQLTPHDVDEDLYEEVAKMKDEVATLKEKMSVLDGVTEAFTGEHMVEALHDLDELREKLLSTRSTTGGDGAENIELPAEIRLNEIENKFVTCTEQINSLDTMFNNQMNILQCQMGDMERELGALVEKIQAGLPAGDAGGIADQSVGELYGKIMSLQAEMDNMAETANKLLDDKEQKQKHMDTMLEQIELLKTIKADKEDLEDALADKADACAINRKVSHDQFDAACDDLSRGIEDALSKLTQQETLWQQALDDIQREIGNKLDKMELTPLRDFVNKKLKALQERLKALAAMKKDQEAAGTKTKILRNVNCISCDKDVVMRAEMDPSLLPKPVSLPPARSMGPYLAYELDALRKQQKSVPGGRNLHHFENAIYGGKAPKEEDHVCNRYCGGSHTTTTPQQRVTRMGHFLNQWGLEQEPVNEGQIRGTDGQYYKARDMGDSTQEMNGTESSYQAQSAGKEASTDQASQPDQAKRSSVDAIDKKRPSSERRMSDEKKRNTRRGSKEATEIAAIPEETPSQAADKDGAAADTARVAIRESATTIEPKTDA